MQVEDKTNDQLISYYGKKKYTLTDTMLKNKLLENNMPKSFYEDVEDYERDD